MQRRNFLRLCGLAGLGFATPIGGRQLLSAEAVTGDLRPYDGPFYVFLNASGGWDTTYMMDPKGVNEMNRLYQEGDILTEGNLRFAPTKAHLADGLSNEDFFGKYADELLVFNGLDYSVNNHSPCSRYMATGRLSSLEYPTFAALAAACRGAEQPLAFLTFGNYSGTGNLVPMSRVPYANSLEKLANADGVNGSSQHSYHDPFVIDRIERALESQFQSRVEQARLPRRMRTQSMLYAAQTNSQGLARVTQYLPQESSKNRIARQADIALAAFCGGVGVSANLSIGQFDSHANNDKDQMTLIPEYLQGVDYLLTRAEELKIREKLVVVLQSEMGRTPTYNKGNGKDHWSIGSIMYIGPGIRGNRVIGATDDKQMLIPIDPRTHALDTEKGVRVRPEHLHTALREYAGIADHPLALRFPLEVPAEEQLVDFWS
ncbi:DUF1501 domain-containing protein [Lignipirellula cremea]|uniref:DUF1501 domain-containing protein n=1 Tax=Lignipirellula cremea TaxID=2528010 RepID=A0A518E0Y2_9BACT|nr:DUF1501 domain-containing protein [Lignipirellula cremea]QDU97758.1 hypothetical protein Pla8534_56140 [Lignipirellula cremea]